MFVSNTVLFLSPGQFDFETRVHGLVPDGNCRVIESHIFGRTPSIQKGTYMIIIV